jgi:CubicO group peptidase (beta-lactamase class C family)
MKSYSSLGTCTDRFAPLRIVFEDLLAADGGKGAALAVCIDGDLVVDLHGGDADDTGSLWNDRTRAVVFSSGKPVAALCVLKLVDAGQLALDRPIAAYWPEFAQAGKNHITLEDVLTHSAGLPYWSGMDRIVRFAEIDSWPDNRDAAEHLAAAAPVVAPRRDLAYHALTYGWLLDEIVMRTTGGDMRELAAEKVAGPLGLRFTFGASDSDVASEHLRPFGDRERRLVAEAYAPLAAEGQMLGTHDPGGVFQVSALANSRRFLTSSQPAINGVADARSLARLYSIIACGGDGGGTPLLSGSLLRKAIAVQRVGRDVLRGAPWALGWGFAHYRRSGFPHFPDGAVGGAGLGGSLAFADPGSRLSFAYVPRALDLRVDRQHERAARLVTVLYSGSGAPRT